MVFGGFSPDEYGKKTYTGEHDTKDSRKNYAETNQSAKEVRRKNETEKNSEINALSKSFKTETADFISGELKYFGNTKTLSSSLLTVWSDWYEGSKTSKSEDGYEKRPGKETAIADNQEFWKVFEQYVSGGNTSYKPGGKTGQEWFNVLKSEHSEFSGKDIELIASILDEKGYGVMLASDLKTVKKINLLAELKAGKTEYVRLAIGFYQFMNGLKVDNRVGPEVLRSLAGKNTQASDALKKAKEDYEKKEKKIWGDFDPSKYVDLYIDSSKKNLSKDDFVKNGEGLYGKEFVYMVYGTKISVVANYDEEKGIVSTSVDVVDGSNYVSTVDVKKVDLLKLEDVQMSKEDTNYGNYKISNYVSVDQEYFEQYATQQAQIFNKSGVKYIPSMKKYLFKGVIIDTNPKDSAVEDANNGLVKIDENLSILQSGFDKRSKLKIETSVISSYFVLEDVTENKITKSVDELSKNMNFEDLEIKISHSGVQSESILLKRNNEERKWGGGGTMSYDDKFDVEYSVMQNEASEDIVKLSLVEKGTPIEFDEKVDVRSILGLKSWDDHLKLMKFIAKNNLGDVIKDLGDKNKSEDAKNKLIQYKNYEPDSRFDNSRKAPDYLEILLPYEEMSWGQVMEVSDLIDQDIDILYGEDDKSGATKDSAYERYSLVRGMAGVMGILLDTEKQYLDTGDWKSEKKDLGYYLNLLEEAKNKKVGLIDFPVEMSKGDEKIVVNYQISLNEGERGGIYIKGVQNKPQDGGTNKMERIDGDYQISFTDKDLFTSKGLFELYNKLEDAKTEKGFSIVDKEKKVKKLENEIEDKKLKLSITKFNLSTEEERTKLKIGSWSDEVKYLLETEGYSKTIEILNKETGLSKDWEDIVKYLEGMFPYSGTSFEMKSNVIKLLIDVFYKDLSNQDTKGKEKDSLVERVIKFKGVLKTMDLIFGKDMLQLNEGWKVVSNPDEVYNIMLNSFKQYEQNGDSAEAKTKKMSFSLKLVSDSGEIIDMPMTIDVSDYAGQGEDYSFGTLKLDGGINVPSNSEYSGSQRYSTTRLELNGYKVDFKDKNTDGSDQKLEMTISNNEQLKIISRETELQRYFNNNFGKKVERNQAKLKEFSDALNGFMSYETINEKDKLEVINLLFGDSGLEKFSEDEFMDEVIGNLKVLTALYNLKNSTSEQEDLWAVSSDNKLDSLKSALTVVSSGVYRVNLKFVNSQTLEEFPLDFEIEDSGGVILVGARVLDNRQEGVIGYTKKVGEKTVVFKDTKSVSGMKISF